MSEPTDLVALSWWGRWLKCPLLRAGVPGTGDCDAFTRQGLRPCVNLILADLCLGAGDGLDADDWSGRVRREVGVEVEARRCTVRELVSLREVKRALRKLVCCDPVLHQSDRSVDIEDIPEPVHQVRKPVMADLRELALRPAGTF